MPAAPTLPVPEYFNQPIGIVQSDDGTNLSASWVAGEGAMPVFATILTALVRPRGTLSARFSQQVMDGYPQVGLIG